MHSGELWNPAPNAVTAKLMGDLHLRPREQVKVPLRVDDYLGQGDKDSGYLIHTPVPDHMWGNVITNVEHQTDGVIGWHLMSFPAGLQVATITQHESMEEYLKQPGRDEMPSKIQVNWQKLIDAEDGKEFHEWSKDIGKHFGWNANGQTMPSM